MSRTIGYTIGVVISIFLWAVIALCVMLAVGGCGDPMTEGILIGAGSSGALSEGADMASESRERLIAEILRLKAEVSAAPSQEERDALQSELDKLEEKQRTADLTASIMGKVKEGIERDWGDKPASPDNLAWILGSAATVLGGIAGKKTYDDKKHVAAINRVKVASKQGDLNQGGVYKAINGA